MLLGHVGGRSTHPAEILVIKGFSEEQAQQLQLALAGHSSTVRGTGAVGVSPRTGMSPAQARGSGRTRAPQPALHGCRLLPSQPWNPPLSAAKATYSAMEYHAVPAHSRNISPTARSSTSHGSTTRPKPSKQPLPHCQGPPFNPGFSSVSHPCCSEASAPVGSQTQVGEGRLEDSRAAGSYLKFVPQQLVHNLLFFICCLAAELGEGLDPPLLVFSLAKKSSRSISLTPLSPPAQKEGELSE